MNIDLNCVGSFILGFLCAILFMFVWMAIKIGDELDDIDQ